MAISGADSSKKVESAAVTVVSGTSEPSAPASRLPGIAATLTAVQAGTGAAAEADPSAGNAAAPVRLQSLFAPIRWGVSVTWPAGVHSAAAPPPARASVVFPRQVVLQPRWTAASAAATAGPVPCAAEPRAAVPPRSDGQSRLPDTQANP